MMTEAQIHRAVALDVGQKVGRLTCRIRWKAAPLYRAYWECTCDCGNSVTVREEHLNSGKTRSCGCLNLETVRATAPVRRLTHGQSKTSLYNVWRSMRQRCHNPNSPSYENYGGRGIHVCERWRCSFENFRHDMGDRPSGASLDRIDNNGNYEPGNCRWADRFTQSHNSRVYKVTPDVASEIVELAKQFPVRAIAQQTDLSLAKIYRVLRDADPQKVKKRNQPEFEFQKQVMAFLDVSLRGCAWATVFPAGGGGKRRGAQLKAGGLRKGVPDILILDGGRACWLELKAKRGRVSADQVVCHAALRHAGASVTVCRTIEDVDAALIRWGVPFNAKVLA